MLKNRIDFLKIFLTGAARLSNIIMFIYIHYLVEIIQSLQGNYKYSQPYPPAVDRL